MTRRLFVFGILFFSTLLFAGSVSAVALTGDGNTDGKVDGIDYVLWVTNFRKSTTLGPAQGDFNSDGITDGIDYTLWLTNFGKTMAAQEAGLLGSYYSGSNLETKVFERVDSTIDFNWGETTRPDPRIGLDTYSIEWNGSVTVPHTGTYTFYTLSDDGTRLFVNGTTLIDDWNRGYGEMSGTISLEAGQRYSIKLQYQEQTLGARIQLSWAHAQIPKQIIASQYLSTSAQVPVTPANTIRPTVLPTAVLPTPTTRPTIVPTALPTAPPTTHPTLPPTSSSLRWSPPALTNPTTITVSTSYGSNLTLDTTKDYIIKMPTTAYPRSLYIIGGRNVHLIGGVISVNADTSSTENAGLRIYDSTGTVHIEGLKLTGTYLTDGIHTKAPNAVVQLQNIYIDPMWQKGDPAGSGSHGDCVQTWGGVKELRIDKFTCSNSAYQGFYLQANYSQPHGNVIMSRVDVTGSNTGRYLFWITPSTFNSTKSVTLDNVWVNSTNRNIDRAVCYYLNSNCTSLLVTGVTSGVESVSWPSATAPRVIGTIREGLPPGGRFVSSTSVGFTYQSPGYQ